MILEPPYWFWAFRYVLSDEPALLVCSKEPATINDITNLRSVARSDLLENRGTHMVSLTFEEWETWHAFNLCPTVEIFRKEGKNHWDYRMVPSE